MVVEALEFDEEVADIEDEAIEENTRPENIESWAKAIGEETVVPGVEMVILVDS